MIRCLILLLICSCSIQLHAQVRYRHLPRVRIKSERIKTNDIHEANLTPVLMSTPLPVSELPESGTIHLELETKSIVHNPVKTMGRNHQSRFKVPDAWRIRLKSNDNLDEVKDVKQTKMEKWMLAMILLYSIGLLLVIAAIIVLMGALSPIGFYILVGLGGIAIAVATLLLVLGLAGLV